MEWGVLRDPCLSCEVTAMPGKHCQWQERRTGKAGNESCAGVWGKYLQLVTYWGGDDCMSGWGLFAVCRVSVKRPAGKNVRLCAVCCAVLCCRHVSSQRYQMAQLHPSVLASTMEAAGLRDADYDDEEDDMMSYDTDDAIMGHMTTDLDQQDQHNSSGPGAAASTAQRMTNQGHVSNYQGLLLSSKSLEAAIGSLTNQGLVSHLSLPLSPSGSTHSSVGHYGAGGAWGHVGHVGVLGHVGPLRHPEHSLRGWLDG